MQRNGARSHQAALQELGQKAQDTRDSLLDFGLLGADEQTPAIMVLDAIRMMSSGEEGARTRFLNMLQERTFAVATSHPIRARWKKVWYTFGPTPKVVSCAVALQLLEAVRKQNDQMLGYPRQAATTRASTNPIVVHWMGFALPDGSFAHNRTLEKDIVATETYSRLRDRLMHQRTAHQVGADAPNLDEVFAHNNPHARTKARNVPQGNGHFQQPVREGLDYHQMTGSIVHDFNPRLPARAADSELDAALSGQAVQPASVAPVIPRSGGDQLPPPPPPVLPPPPPLPKT